MVLDRKPRSYWLFIAALGWLISYPIASQEPVEPPGGSQTQAAPDNQSAAEAGNQPAPPEVPPPDLRPVIQDIETAIRDLIAEQRRAESEQPDNHEMRDLYAQEDMAKWARWMFIAAAASVVLTFAGVVLIRWTLNATEKAAGYAKIAADAALKTVEQAKRATGAAIDTVEATRIIGNVQNRAYIAFKPVNIAFVPCSEAGIRKMEGPFKLTLTGILTNFGNSPARNIIVKNAIRVVSDSPPFLPETLRSPELDQSFGAIAPRADAEVKFVMDVVLNESLILRDVENIVVVGVITYDTMGPGKGETRSTDYVTELSGAARCVATTGNLENTTFTRTPTGNDMT